MLCPVVDDPLYKQKGSDNNLFSYKPKAFLVLWLLQSVTRQFPVNQSLSGEMPELQSRWSQITLTKILYSGGSLWYDSGQN